MLQVRSRFKTAPQDAARMVMMERLIKGAAIGLAALAMTAATASAHTLSKGAAALNIRIEASDFFEWKFEDPDHFVTYPSVHKYDCWRETRHTVECPGTFQVLDWSDTDFPLDRDCEFEARARFRSHGSFEPRVRILNHDCY
jgi:hypothetical protein